ncbi:hypothetical protein IFR04_001289 [Cadophora malorum]|uniref:Uncharacterized protein n=1 Tax=Cadophora malorum TaxID=108018 RepID=A0A8H7WIV3_9HELO|nr:hypothetical protein IFR04_001289 [Cadophora malorum]|tara:strand:- start:694 stop:906 length:213 start_codon:yes stop_codon:yes gene_type:complete
MAARSNNRNSESGKGSQFNQFRPRKGLINVLLWIPMLKAGLRTVSKGFCGSNTLKPKETALNDALAKKQA